ncbi:MAG: site-specific DNA-methyltransferase [Candidatus Cloacimonetes bacterium]|jgi:site-specific DNA-methyltransferase (adenine-specific)|nr:site-specific DNA-methyltransferase [Candidatus Cloacimonadota bacterium]
MNQLINADCLDYLNTVKDRQWDTIFADPPDGINLKYASYSDLIDESDYINSMHKWLSCFVLHAKTVWLSYNAKWTFKIGSVVENVVGLRAGELEVKSCVQVFTFGQHNQKDLGNNFRPLLRLRWKDAPLFPDKIRIPSWRQANGDKRADPRGRVPGDVFYFPRVTGNSKQRRSWCPTQLNEGLIERCLKMTTPDNGTVLDPFCGTGTTLRVCEKLGFSCTLVEREVAYCDELYKEHGIKTEYVK